MFIPVPLDLAYVWWTDRDDAYRLCVDISELARSRC